MWATELIDPGPHEQILDVATGPGRLAFELSKHAHRVTGVDITTEMLALAGRYKADHHIENTQLTLADGGALPFRKKTFDIVSCRFAFHHFLEPEKVLSEMKRVLRPQGKIIIIDVISPEEMEKSEYQNQIERARDPSHVRHYRPSEITRMLG